ncbi:MAG: DMT family transporter [Pseudomonadota bacterium]
MQPELTTRAWADLILLGLIWGASFLAIKLALGELPVVTLVAHRVFWAAALLWALALWRGWSMPRGARIWGAFLVMGTLNNIVPFLLMAWGQQFIETGLTAIFNSATAIWGVLVAALFFADERLSARRVTGVALAFGGVVLALGAEALRGFDLRSLAQLAVLAGTLSYAFASAWARSRLSHLPPQVAATGMLTAASALMLPLALIIDGLPQVPSLAITYAAIAYYALPGTALAYLLYYRIVAQAGSGNAMLVTLIIPPVSIILGAVTLGERLAPTAIGGFVLIAAGLVVLDGRIPRRLSHFLAARNRAPR